jgi:hypothetical protein
MACLRLVSIHIEGVLGPVVHQTIQQSGLRKKLGQFIRLSLSLKTVFTQIKGMYLWR